MKTFWLNWEISKSKSQLKKDLRNSLISFLGWRLNFFWAHVIMQDICNKFIGSNFSIGCMVWPWCCQFQDSTTMSLINKLNLIFFSSGYPRPHSRGTMSAVNGDFGDHHEISLTSNSNNRTESGFRPPLSLPYSSNHLGKYFVRCISWWLKTKCLLSVTQIW